MTIDHLTNAALAANAIDAGLRPHLRREAELLLAIDYADRANVCVAANGMTNRCGGRYSDALELVATAYLRDPEAWRADRKAAVTEQLAAQARQREASTAVLRECERNRKARLAAAASEGNAAMLGEQARVDAERQQVMAQRTALRQQANEGR